MKITADTNLILRTLLNDDPRQSSAARKMLGEAELVAITLPTLCEIDWVMRKAYRRSRADVAGFMRIMVSTDNVAVDTTAVEAGLAMIEAGGDFADGVIGHEGRRLGGEVFATFDKSAATLAERMGFAVTLPIIG